MLVNNSQPVLPPLEMWGGLECTVNRVGDHYLDQMQRNGHATRISDLNLFAGLGIRALRYPVLWEHFAPDNFDNINWSWADQRINRLNELGVKPIIGLTHHGSGPRHTSLVDESFAEGLAQYARLVAERYPKNIYYTPVNEPLTTARFSTLYGHWYPHTKDEGSFVKAILNQCRAVVLAMREIRQVNPDAKLVQTEDIGRFYSTPLLAYEADMFNERRWLSLDLLCGQLTPSRLMWNKMLEWGAKEAELQWFLENPCPPDIMGLNHYLTSDRYLDEEVEKYPEEFGGYSNGVHTYADVEAVRVCPNVQVNAGPLLREAWMRYGLPLAVTEAHLGCTREEQLRWLKEVWDDCVKLREDHVDVRAVTAWSLLGAFDWNSLVTQAANFYEPGVFDVRNDQPRQTAIARMMRVLGAGKPYDHPVLDQPGWWRRPDRLAYPAAGGRSAFAAPVRGGHDMSQQSVRPLLIVGATGTLGRAFARLCDARAIPYHVTSRAEIDISDPASVDAAMDRIQPWAVINAAGFVRVDEAETQREACFEINAHGAARLAAACARHAIPLMTFSSDLVFDGLRARPYLESDVPAPLNVYGQSKLRAENRVLEILPDSLVIRTSSFFGPWDDANFVTIALRALSAGETFIAAGDVIISPTYVADLVHAALDLLIDGENGVWHLANKGTLSWADLARRAAEMAGISTGVVEARPAYTLGYSAARPHYSALGSERGQLLPSVDDALERYLSESDWIRAQRETDGGRVAHSTPPGLDEVASPSVQELEKAA
ncbi:MAG TPA: family 1 glycosylhydrolase [Abditibacterium sp.]|jgi:dTDP-4-dehydrorhamnose reductase